MRFSFMLALLCACTPVMGHQIATVGNDTEVWPEDPAWECQSKQATDDTSWSYSSCSIIFAEQIEGDGRRIEAITGLECENNPRYPNLSNRCHDLPLTAGDTDD